MKKRIFLVFLILVLLIILALVYGAVREAQTTDPVRLSETQVPLNADFDTLRIENEAKLVVPQDQIEVVWSYLLNTLVEDKTTLKQLNPGFDSYWYDEIFTDDYFDTPDLVLLDHQSSIRHRLRINLTDPEQEKSGRELLQIKINDINANEQSRGELKFDIRDDGKTDDTDDLHPVIGLTKDGDREEFFATMRQLGIDPYQLQKILKLEQHRRSIYITLDGEAFMSIRFDEVHSKMLWVPFSHCEIEIELNEIPYTEGDDAYRAYMEDIKEQIMKDVLKQFPFINLDLTPKYNKAFNYFAEKIPGLRFLIQLGVIS